MICMVCARGVLALAAALCVSSVLVSEATGFRMTMAVAASPSSNTIA